MLGDKASKATSALVTSSMTKSFAGGYVELLAFLIFLAGATLLAQLLRSDDELGSWLSSLMTGSGVIYEAVTIATSLAAGAAAVYDGHHGASLATVAERVLALTSAKPGAARHDDGLTDREREILALLGKGSSNAQIACTLSLSLKTVQNYVSKILDKLQVSDRTQAALKARPTSDGGAV